MCVLTNSLVNGSLTRATDNHRMGLGARLKAINAKNFSTPLRVNQGKGQNCQVL
jgi:hypothetical protein